MTRLACPTVVHERLKLDDAWWHAQRFIGVQSGFGLRPDAESRNCCACGSTLYKPIVPAPTQPEACHA